MKQPKSLKDITLEVEWAQRMLTTSKTPEALDVRRLIHDVLLFLRAQEPAQEPDTK